MPALLATLALVLVAALLTTFGFVHYARYEWRQAALQFKRAILFYILAFVMAGVYVATQTQPLP